MVNNNVVTTSRDHCMQSIIQEYVNICSQSIMWNNAHCYSFLIGLLFSLPWNIRRVRMEVWWWQETRKLMWAASHTFQSLAQAPLLTQISGCKIFSRFFFIKIHPYLPWPSLLAPPDDRYWQCSHETLSFHSDDFRWCEPGAAEWRCC